MSKRRLTHRERLKQMIREAESNEALQRELLAVQIALEKPRPQAVKVLINLLKTSSCRETQWFISKVLGTSKDPRAIKPLMQSAVALENKGYSCNFLWPLDNFDCTAHLNFFVHFMLKEDDPGEAMLACYNVIAHMKGPFKPDIVKKNIKKLLGKSKLPPESNMKLQAEHFKMSAANDLMSKYFVQVAKEFHGKNGTTGG